MAPKLHAPQSLTFSCTGCGDCCKHWPVPVSDADAARIAALDWRALCSHEVPAFTRELGDGTRALVQDAQRRCIFLDETERCRLHEAHGEAAKPLACRLFPFSFLEADGEDPRLIAAFACKSVAAGSGAPIASQRKALLALRGELEAAQPSERIPGSIPFDRELDYRRESLRALLELTARAFSLKDLPLSKQLLIATRFIDLMAASRFADLLDPKRRELMEKFYEGHRNQVRKGLVSAPQRSPSFPERVLLRQLVGFCTLDHAPLMARVTERFGSRLSRLWHGIVWTIGWGQVRWRDGRAGPRWKALLKDAPPADLDADAARPLARYLRVSLESGRLLAGDLRRRAIVPALGMLALQVPIVVILARARALHRGAAALEEQDWVEAVRQADLSFGAFPLVSGPLGDVRRRLMSDVPAVWAHIGAVSGAREDA